MPLIDLVVALIVVGVLLWAVNTYIPMDAQIKQIMNIVVVIAVVLWLLRVFGILGSFGDIRVENEAPTDVQAMFVAGGRL